MTRPGRAADFYDSLAADYHLLYRDWERAGREQSTVLHELLRHRLGDGALRVLDAAVGIGTQLVGLAGLGHAVVGSDISRDAVRRAQVECRTRALPDRLAVADMRALPFRAGAFDAVVCADNAVAHLLTAGDVAAALRELARVTRPGGRLLVSTRDYEQARRDHPPGTLPQVASLDGGESVAVQVWRWHDDGARYDLEHLLVIRDGDAWTVRRRLATLWALTRDELASCAARAGLVDVGWLDPADTGFFQPVLVATVPPVTAG